MVRLVINSLSPWQGTNDTAECCGNFLQGRQYIRPGPTWKSQMQAGPTLKQLEDAVSSQATYGARRAVGTHDGPSEIHLADYSLRHWTRRDDSAGTTILYHLHIYRRAHSLSVMTTGRQSCWSMGTAAASAWAAGPFEGLWAGRSSGRTKLEYTAASGRHDHATFGSAPTRQSDDRDSEPDYLVVLATSDDARAGCYISRLYSGSFLTYISS